MSYIRHADHYVCRTRDGECLVRRTNRHWETSVPGSGVWSACPTASASYTRAAAVEAHFFYHRDVARSTSAISPPTRLARSSPPCKAIGRIQPAEADEAAEAS